MPNLRHTIRQTVYQAEKLAQRVKFASLPTPVNGWPVLLGISFPKSGTHLLDQILLGFSGVAPFSRRLHSFYAQYDGDTGRKRANAETVAWLESLRPRDITSAHLFSSPEALQRVCAPTFVPYFIFRDPRDVVVSHVFYVTDMEPNHVHHAYYQSLPDFETRLKTSILGLSPSPNGRGAGGEENLPSSPALLPQREGRNVEFPDIAKRFEPYLGWLDRPEVLAIHFEDLVNDRAAALSRIIDHFLARVPLTTPRQKILDSLEASINPQKSPTFRSGKTGEWKKYFQAEHKAIFKEVAGDLLIRLGYEQDGDW